MSWLNKHVWAGVLGVLALIVILLALPKFLTSSYEFVEEPLPLVAISESLPTIPVTHIETPESVKALYMTACVAGTPSWRTALAQLIDDTELNAVVIDIKDSTGIVSFSTNLPQGAGGRGCVVSDMQEFIAELHDRGIYVIGRISVFQDPSYTQIAPELAVQASSTGTVWKDYKGLSFIDVGATLYWDYIVALAEASYNIGFDELNFDYVRYPSDGDMKDAVFTWTSTTTTRAIQLENFFSYLYQNLKNTGATLSVDLFGMTTTNKDDLGIGQVLERALPYFDYVAPMVYPSHYPKDWNGFANPAEYPYEVIRHSMQKAVDRERVWREMNGLATTTPSKLRPWLQDFNLGATYDADKVRAQIQATYDTGLSSWMIWNAANRYTRDALETESSF